MAQNPDSAELELPVSLAEAIRTVEIDSSEILRYLIDVATYNPDWNLKKAACRRICEDMTVDDLQLEERMRLLLVLSQKQEGVITVVPKVLFHWSTFICRELLGEKQEDNLRQEDHGGDIPKKELAQIPWLILDKLDVIGYPKVSEDAVFQLLLMCIQPGRFLNCNSLSQYILLIKDKIMNKMNYSKVTEENLEDVMKKIFFWRVFVKFTICKAKDAAEKDSIKSQLLPPLLAFCEFAEGLITWVSVQHDAYDSHLIQIVRDVLELLKWSDHDECGMNAYHKLLTAVLTSKIIPADDDIIERCVFHLFLFHYPNKDDLQAAILDICSIVETITQRDPTYVVDEEDVDTGNNEEKTLDASCHLHCLIIIEKMMNTLRIKDGSDPVLEGLIGGIVGRAFMTKDRAMRRYAFKSITRLCLFDKKYCRDKLEAIKCAVKVDCQENKESLVHGISDMVMRYGYDVMASMFGLFELNNGKKMRLAEYFAYMMDDPANSSSLLPHAVVRAFAKWMMHEDSPEWTLPLARMLLFCSRWDFESDNIMTSRRRLIFSFLIDYVKRGRSKKLTLARSLICAMDLICTDFNPTARCSMDIDDIVEVVARLTVEDETVLREEFTKTNLKRITATPIKPEKRTRADQLKALFNATPSVHVQLMGITLSYLSEHSDHPYLISMTKMMAKLRLDGLLPEMAAKCDWDDQLTELIEKIISEQKKAKPLLRATLRNVKSALRLRKRTRLKKPRTIEESADE